MNPFLKFTTFLALSSSAAALSANVMNPNRLDRPVCASSTILTSSTCPYVEKNRNSSDSVVSRGRPPTNTCLSRSAADPNPREGLHLPPRVAVGDVGGVSGSPYSVLCIAAA